MNYSDGKWFVEARFGLFVHYGLYSLLGRGEWVMNRERITPAEYRKLADQFTAEKFDAGQICDLAVKSGMKYVNLTTMHHDGFRLYETELSDFHSVRACGRDLVDEFINAARKRGLRIALYHSLNNWMDQPDAVAALESEDAYDEFIANTHARLKELVTRFNPIDLMWYDGWWPFGAGGWQSEKMNAMIREIQPHILFNGRNALPGDFATPEGHMTAPTPWRPWEACMTLNDNWGYHAGDSNWKTPGQVIDLLAKAAAGNGNLLLNIGPKGDGSIPQESLEILRAIGQWVQINKECMFGTDLFTCGFEKREPHHRADFTRHGPLTAKGNNLYQWVRYWPGETLVIVGLQMNVQEVTVLGADIQPTFTQTGDVLKISGLRATPPDDTCTVLKIRCEAAPELYNTAGMRVPNVPHTPYDPVASEIMH